MNTLIFHNPGEIDIRGACIAGLSAKESKSPIGYFGTGLKYSIACILRWGGSVTIYSGETEYVFTTGSIQFRGSEFSVVYMNGEPLGFTTEYGKNWMPWQVFRELYANARDENGAVHLNTHPSMIGPGYTHIFVTCEELVPCFYDRDKIILPKDKIYDHASTEVLFSETPAEGLYYRGVRVLDQPCNFTWNFQGELPLTEDRTLHNVYAPTHIFDQFIVQDLHDIEIIMTLFKIRFKELPSTITRRVVREGKQIETEQRSCEAMLMDWFTIPSYVASFHSDAYKQACCRLFQRDPTKYAQLRNYVKEIDSSLIAETQHQMTPREQLMFDKSKELVVLFGMAAEIDACSIYVQELGGTTLGLYEHGNIYLSPKLFDQGTKQLVATLYEECYHHRTANKDCTYNMQNDLFNIIISLNEELHKVIC